MATPAPKIPQRGEAEDAVRGEMTWRGSVVDCGGDMVDGVGCRRGGDGVRERVVWRNLHVHGSAHFLLWKCETGGELRELSEVFGVFASGVSNASAAPACSVWQPWYGMVSGELS